MNSFLKRLGLGVGAWLLAATTAWAQLGSVPYTFVPGTTILSAEVNSNFSTAYSNALNRTGGTMTGTLTTLDLLPTASNASDLGSATFFYRSMYAKTSIVLGQTTANYTLTWANPASARAISIADPGGTDVFTFNAATQTLTNKTLTSPAISSPTLSGTAIGTYTLGGTPSITAPILSGTITGTYTLGGTPSIAASAITGSHTLADGVLSTNVPLLNAANTFSAANPIILGSAANGTIRTDTAGFFTVQAGTSGFDWHNNAYNTALMTLSNTGALAVNGALNGFQSIVAANTTSGTSAGSFLRATAGTTIGQLVSTSQGYTTGSFDIQASTYLSGSGVGGVSLVATDAAGVLRFFTNSLLRWAVNAAGDLTFGASSHNAISSGTPALSTGWDAGGSRGIAGTDYAFIVTNGAAVSGGGIVTFGHGFNTTPVCMAIADNGAVLHEVTGTSSTTQVQLLTPGPTDLGAGTKVYGHCFGY